MSDPDHHWSQQLSMIVLASILLSVSHTARAEQVASCRVTNVAENDVLNIRELPSSKSRILGIVPPNAKGFKCFSERSGDWVVIYYGHSVGWASSRFLAIENRDMAAADSVDPPASYHIANSNSTTTPSEPPHAVLFDDEVHLTAASGGMYFVPVKVNDEITLDFLIDTGASDILVPADVALTLLRTKTLTLDDFTGERIYILADGSKLPSAQFVLRKLQVGGHTVFNVTASVGKVTSQPLLGQSFLSKFTSWTMDNKRHVLTLSRGPSTNFPTSLPLSATAPLRKPMPELEPSKRWIVIASRGDLHEAISVAKRYRELIPNTIVITSENGNYGVTVGQFDLASDPALLTRLVNAKQIPSDSYVTSGKRFQGVVWQ